MRPRRVAAGHVVAAVAALVLLLVMATNWYGSHEADLARQLGNAANIGGAEAGEVGRAVKADADRIIARDEKNPWQERATVDRVLLVLLLLAVALPLIAAAVAAAGSRSKTPTALAALAAVAAAVLLAYRIVNQPGNNGETTVKTGALLGLAMLALIGIGSVWAYQREPAPEAAGEDATPPHEPDTGSPSGSGGDASGRGGSRPAER